MLKILDYDSFIYEKLGVHSDVRILSDFLYDELKNYNFEIGKTIIIKNNTILSFRIKEFRITVIPVSDVVASFDYRKSKYTSEGYIIFLNLSERYNKDFIYHELTHVILHDKLTTKKIDYKLGSYNSVNLIIFKDEFKNMINMLYYSDDSEISSYVHQVYSELNEYFESNEITNKNFENFLIKNEIYNISKQMMNYVIFEDFSAISEKQQLLFFRVLYDLKDMKLKTNYNKLRMIFKVVMNIITNNQKTEYSLNSVKKQTQQYINNQGTKLYKKITRLYGLL